jgi:hypothetical protein
MLHRAKENLICKWILWTQGKDAVVKYHVNKIIPPASPTVPNTMLIVINTEALRKITGRSIENNFLIVIDLMRAADGHVDDVEFRTTITIPFLEELSTNMACADPMLMRPIILKWLLRSGDIRQHWVDYNREAVDAWVNCEDLANRRRMT